MTWILACHQRPIVGFLHDFHFWISPIRSSVIPCMHKSLLSLLSYRDKHYLPPEPAVVAKGQVHPYSTWSFPSHFLEDTVQWIVSTACIWYNLHLLQSNLEATAFIEHWYAASSASSAECCILGKTALACKLAKVSLMMLQIFINKFYYVWPEDDPNQWEIHRFHEEDVIVNSKS